MQSGFIQNGMSTLRHLLAAAFVVACLIWLCGCTPKFVVLVDGYPSPGEVDVAWSQDGQITAKWFFSRWYPKKIESRGHAETIDYPEHLSFDQQNILGRDTSHVVANLQIHNPHMKRYRLVRVVTIDNTESEEEAAGWTIREFQSVAIPGPIVPGKEIKMALKVFSEEAEGLHRSIISTGDLHYVINPSEKVAQEEKERR